MPQKTGTGSRDFCAKAGDSRACFRSHGRAHLLEREGDGSASHGVAIAAETPDGGPVAVAQGEGEAAYRIAKTTEEGGHEGIMPPERPGFIRFFGLGLGG